MSAYYSKVYGQTKEEAEQKARDQISKMDYMRQPSLYAVTPVDNSEQKSQGLWCAVIKYWGLD